MSKKVIFFWSIFILSASVRVLFSLAINRPDIGQCLKQILVGNGTVIEDPSRTETGQVLVIQVEKMGLADSAASTTDVSCRNDLTIRAKTKLYPRFKYGDRIVFTGKLNLPYNFKSDDGRSFDYKGYLAKNDIYYEMKSAVVTLRETSTQQSGLIGWIRALPERISYGLFAIKRSFVANLEQTLGEPHSALAAGLVVGEKSALGPQLLEDFRIVGLIHIVVLSGFNITIVADALRRMLSRLPRIWGITIGGIGMLLFGVLVGGGATVVRSCFMASLALFADLARRDYNVVRALIFAALIMLMQNPLILLHDPSFQLSFLATLGLILLASPIEKRITWIPDKFGMRGTVAACLATQIFVSPFILYMMGQLSIIGVVVNILVLPFIPLTMLAVFLTGALGFIPGMIFAGVSQVMGWCAHIFLSYELFMVTNFARIPYAAIRVPQFSGWFVVAFYVTFFCVYYFIVRKSSDPMPQQKNSFLSHPNSN